MVRGAKRPEPRVPGEAALSEDGPESSGRAAGTGPGWPESHGRWRLVPPGTAGVRPACRPPCTPQRATRCDQQSLPTAAERLEAVQAELHKLPQKEGEQSLLLLTSPKGDPESLWATCYCFIILTPGKFFC